MPTPGHSTTCIESVFRLLSSWSKFVQDGVHAEILDFPGVITFGASQEEARRLLASALVDMAETNLLLGEPLPRPDPGLTDPEADLEEPIHLLLTATSRVELVPQSAAS